MEHYCPYKIIWAYLAVRSNKEDVPFFVFRDDKPVSGDMFHRVMRNVIRSMGLNPLNYDTHSFCIGQAMDLQKMRMSLSTMKKMGRWKSNSVYWYLK